MKSDALSKIEKMLSGIRSVERAEDVISVFMRHLYRLGLEVDTVDPGELGIFLKDTSRLILEASNPLHCYLFDAENILTNEFYDNEWIRVCQKRSTIEFLRYLYFDYIDTDWDLFMDCENLDDMLSQKGDFEGGWVDPIPKGIPVSHWWWWYPEKPPAHR